MRMLGRGIIAWSPVLISGVLLKFVPFRMDDSLAPFVMLGGLVVVFAIASLVQRERGLQDLLAGTWLVPR